MREERSRHKGWSGPAQFCFFVLHMGRLRPTGAAAGLSSARGQSWPLDHDVHCPRFWAGWSPVGSRTRGTWRQTEGRVLGLVGACGWWPLLGFSTSSPLEPCCPQGLWPRGLRAVGGPWGFSGKPTALCLGLQWNHPSLTVLLTPACLAGAKPTAFPKGQCGCRTSRPLSMASVSQRPWEPALRSPLTLTRSLCQ